MIMLFMLNLLATNAISLLLQFFYSICLSSLYISIFQDIRTQAVIPMLDTHLT